MPSRPGAQGDAAAGRGAGLPPSTRTWRPFRTPAASRVSETTFSGYMICTRRARNSWTLPSACSTRRRRRTTRCRGAFGPGNWTRPASADLSGNLRDKIASYRGNLAQAFRSDDSLRMRVADAAEGVLSLLDPVALATPPLRAPMLSTAPDPVPALRAALEDLEAVGAERAGIEDMMRQLKENDNIMSKVMAKTGDDYETLFASEIAKYDRAREAVASNVSSQSDILSRLRDNHATFLEQYDVPAWRAAMASHAETVRAATAHHRELSSGVERGQTFYAGFAQAVAQLGADCEGFVENRRREKRELEQAVAQRAQQAATVAEHHAAATAAAQRAAADQGPRRNAPPRSAGVHAREGRGGGDRLPDRLRRRASQPSQTRLPRAQRRARSRRRRTNRSRRRRTNRSPGISRSHRRRIRRGTAGIRHRPARLRPSISRTGRRPGHRLKHSTDMRRRNIRSRRRRRMVRIIIRRHRTGRLLGQARRRRRRRVTGVVPVDARDGCDDTTVFAHRIKNRGILMNRSRLPASLPHHVRQILHVLSLLPVMM